MAESEAIGNLQTADIIVVVCYFVCVLGIGLWSSISKESGVGGFFLAGRNMHFIPIGASLFVSNIGSGHFTGLAGLGAKSGIGTTIFELNAIMLLLVLGWIFLPVYTASNVFTMPEYLEKRFPGPDGEKRQRIRLVLSLLSLLLYVTTKISADLHAGTLFVTEALHWDMYSSIVLLVCVAAVFTMAGGLNAVIWTDFIQSIIMVVGALVLMVFSLSDSRVGGYEGLYARYPKAIPNYTLVHMNDQPPDNFSQCGLPDKYAFNFFRPADDSTFPWIGVIFGAPILSLWYWCADQVIVQRALAAKNMSHAKAGTILAGYLKFLPMWIIVVPGMAARILFTDDLACATPQDCMAACGNEYGCGDSAYPKLVVNLLPDGARGLMLAVMMSALMSSLTSVFNSASTLFTMDIWARFRKNQKSWEPLVVGRLFVVVLVGVSIAWLPILQAVNDLFFYIQEITSYLAPPVAAVYFLALGWSRINEQGAFWGLMVGLLAGIIRMIIWVILNLTDRKPCGAGEPLPDIISKMHFLHFAILLFFLTIIVAVIVSLCTQPLEEKYLEGLLYWNCYNKKPKSQKAALEKSRDQGHDNRALDTMEAPSIDGVINAYENSTYGANGVSAATAEPIRKPLPRWKQILYNFCGMEDPSQPQVPPGDIEPPSLDEKPFWRKVCNVNAIILLAICLLQWIVFA